MIQNVKWSDEAKESLANIYDYIFENSPQNAEHVILTLLELRNSLEDSRFDYSQDLLMDDDRFRFITKWSYKIIYERTLLLHKIMRLFKFYRFLKPKNKLYTNLNPFYLQSY